MTKNDHKLDLTVKSTSGSFSDTWNENNKAERVYDDAVKHFGLDRSATYILKRERDDVVLALSEKLEDLGLKDGDVLILQASQAQDG
jgi:hypothetical protein